MRLFEAIVQANHRAVAGDVQAGIRPDDFADALPVVALSCIDPRLNPLLPEVLGLPEHQFIWLRNAGNIITSSLSSTLRSLALACAVKGAREIAIIGHTDCQVRKTSVVELTDRFKALGLERAQLPENLTEYFGLFASERANVMRGVEFVRHSPLIGPAIPVHGLLVDITSGKLEWVVDGYQSLALGAAATPAAASALPGMPTALGQFADFKFEEIKFPDFNIGDAPTTAPTPAGLPPRTSRPRSTQAPSATASPAPPVIPASPKTPPVIKLTQPWKLPPRRK